MYHRHKPLDPIKYKMVFVFIVVKGLEEKGHNVALKTLLRELRVTTEIFNQDIRPIET
jgi:hypothetical protein